MGGRGGGEKVTFSFLAMRENEGFFSKGDGGSFYCFLEG